MQRKFTPPRYDEEYFKGMETLSQEEGGNRGNGMADTEKENKELRTQLAEMQKELTALRKRLEEEVWTNVTYWQIYERHQSPYTSFMTLNGNPLNLRPGESRRARIILEERKS